MILVHNVVRGVRYFSLLFIVTLHYGSVTSIPTWRFYVTLRALLGGYTKDTFGETEQTAFKTGVAASAE